MTQDTYRFAYEEASAELREILGQFEQLRHRKAQMEQVVEALKPILTEAVAVTAPPGVDEAVPYLVQQQLQVPVVPVAETVADAFSKSEAEAEEESPDPVQRRIDNALRHGFGGRDSRVLSLGLNSLLTRA